MNKKTVRIAFRILLSLAMIAAGVMHFAATNSFARIIPNFLPEHRLLVEISGACEIALGMALMIPKIRRISGWGLIALYIAVFPANINMAVRNLPIGGAHHPVLLWARLPLQIVLIAWAWWVSLLKVDRIE